MKKIFSIFAIVIASFTVNAQVTFDLGLRGGANFARFTQNDNNKEKFKTINDFYVGAYGALNFTKFYTLQPELNYSRQGAEREYLTYEYNSNGDQIETMKTETLKVSYLTIGVINKFKFNRFNIHLGPSIDVKMNDRSKDLVYNSNGYNTYYYDNYNNYYDDMTEIDFAFTGGVGFNIVENLGVEARIKKGVIPVDGDWGTTNILYQVGLTYNFNLKK